MGRTAVGGDPTHEIQVGRDNAVTLSSNNRRGGSGELHDMQPGVRAIDQID